MRKLRLSAISFLNTAPLMWDFDHGKAGRDFDVSYTIPSQCAEALQAGTADVGLIPAVTYATIPDLAIIPDVVIASKNIVRSILLVSKIPIEQVKTVGADISSRTSVTLARLLFRKWFGGDRSFTPMSPDINEMLSSCDAGLLIGDNALAVDGSPYWTYDLAEEWRRLTGKPFVFAFWAVRLQALSEMRPDLDLSELFKTSRDHGLEPAHIAKIAKDWAPKVGISEADVTSYLTTNIDYFLDTENLEGMALFFQYAYECGLIPEIPSFRFLGNFAMSISGLYS